MKKEITSINNPLVKEILLLQEKSKARKKSGLFIIEGLREVTLALKGGYQLDKLLYCKEIADMVRLGQFDFGNSSTIEISKEVYERIARRDSTEGLIAIAHTKDLSIGTIKLSRPNPLILVAEAPEKPGNIGALLRTADAANLDAVFIANPKTDMYNPNIIRSSIGCVFTNQIATGSSSEIIEFLKNAKIQIYSAALGTSEPYATIDYTVGTAIVVGTEAIGLSNEWLLNSTNNVMIPMSGEIDSLNVSVAAAVLIFEAKRQRNYD